MAVDFGTGTEKYTDGSGNVIYTNPAKPEMEAYAKEYGLTAAETAAGVTVVNPERRPGEIERYGENTTPGTTDMSAAFTAAAAQSSYNNARTGARVTGDGNYLLNSTVNLRNAKVDLESATIHIGHSGIGLIIGGQSHIARFTQRIGDVFRDVGVGSSAAPDIRMMGMKGQHIHINRAYWIQAYCDADDGDVGHSTSIAYSNIWIKWCNTLEWNSNPDPVREDTQWINECDWYLNRVFHFISDATDTYGHNNNRLYGGNFEYDHTNNTPASMLWNRGRSNTWRHLRFEFAWGQSAFECTFGTQAKFNEIFASWTSSQFDNYEEAIYGNSAGNKIIDNGIGNTVKQEASLYRDPYIVAKLSVDDPIFDTNAGIEHEDLKPSLGVIQSEGGWDYMFFTKKFRILKNDILGFYTETMSDVTPGYRIIVYLYDSNGDPVLPQLSETGIIDLDAGDNYYSNVIKTITSPNRVSSGSDQPEGYMVIGSDSPAWAEVQIRSSSTHATEHTAREIVIFLRRGTSDPDIRRMVTDSGIYLQSVTAVPTQGYAPLGYSIIDTSGNTHTVIRSVDTAVATSALTSSSGEIAVDDATGVVSGDIVGILNDDIRITDWTTCDGSISGSGPYTVPIAGTPTGNCAIGNRVVFMKWG